MAVCASLHFAGWRRSMMNLVRPDSASSVALTFPPLPTHNPLPGSALASSRDVGLVTLRSVSAQSAIQGSSPIGLLTMTYCDIDLLQLPFPRHQLFPSQNYCIISKPRSRALTILRRWGHVTSSFNSLAATSIAWFVLVLTL